MMLFHNAITCQIESHLAKTRPMLMGSENMTVSDVMLILVQQMLPSAKGGHIITSKQ